MIPTVIGEQRLLAELRDGHSAIRISLLGNSVANGSSASEHGRRWHRVLRNYLLDAGHDDVEVWEGGAVDGSTVDRYRPGGDLHGHVDFAAEHQRGLTAVVLLFRINEHFGQMSTAEYAEHLDGLLTELRERCPSTTAVVVNPPWTYPVGEQPERPTPQQVYRDIGRQLARRHGALHVAAEYGHPGDNSCGTYVADGIHLSDAGQVALATAVFHHLRGAARLG